MNHLRYLLLLISVTSFSQSNDETGKSTIIPKTLLIQDNIQRVIYDYTQSGEMGLIKMHAPFGWEEPIVEAQFEIRGIVLEGLLGLEYQNSEEHIVSGNGFVIPKNKRVRIFNAGEEELILIEVLRPAYKKELVQQFKKLN
ncbi:MAG: hypothetical protein P8M33_04005 [Flavobacteriaceae bacterium]|nr:hypothetical protein [Flavobacteriaceae bacterium]MDG2447046.1 hypothetical protein [Flavobacteriaceae bacterium]